MMETSSLNQSLSDRAHALQASKIRLIAELGMRETDVVPLWFGEGSWPTTPLISQAAIASLNANNHFYQPNNGSWALRSEICSYSARVLGADLAPERITVTPSGMQGLMLVAELLTTPNDRVVVLEPGWPNVVGAFAAMGAEIVSQPIVAKGGRWTLDIDALVSKLTPDTKAVVLNSPNNPTGWTMSAEEQEIILAHCRRYGIWIVADDVYSRLYRHGRHAPSFLSIAAPEDRLISVNSFSKCWSMTGWRLGWIVAPAALEAKLGQLTEFNTSCTAGFIQDAGIAALRHGEDEIISLMRRIGEGYLLTAEKLAAFSRVAFIEPDGAFYCFFKVDGLADSFEAAKNILTETKVGLAPGVAFGSMGEGYLRLCYAQPAEVLDKAFDRLERILS